MLNVIDSKSTITASGFFHTCPLLMNLQQSIIKQQSYITYCTAPIFWKAQFIAHSRHNIICCLPSICPLPSGLPQCSTLLCNKFFYKHQLLPSSMEYYQDLTWQSSHSDQQRHYSKCHNDLESILR